MRNIFTIVLSVIFSVSMFFGVGFADGTYTATTAGSHAISCSGGTATYSNVTVTKTGDPSGSSDDYDFKGTNAAVYAGNGGNLTITGSSTTISSNAKYGNAVFSYGGGSGDGTKITISDATITTSKNNSGGIMVTGGGILNAENLTITTSGGSSAAIRSDQGGGTMNVDGGTYTTSGTGSPAIYSTASITVSNAELNSNSAQGVVIEGGNSVTLTKTSVNANHSTLNSQDSTHQAVLIYQSMSGDASDGTSSFSMTGGSITNENGDIFCITNTTCTITLNGVEITNNDSSGNFLRAASQNWGESGSNGGNVTLTAKDQNISGGILVDSSSSLTMNLSGNSTYEGTINSANAGSVNVTIGNGSTLKLSGNSYVKSLTNNGSINYGTYSINVGGTSYNSENPYAGGQEVDDGDDDGDETKTETETKIGSSGGGCNMGFLSAGFLILSFIPFTLKKFNKK